MKELIAWTAELTEHDKEVATLLRALSESLEKWGLIVEPTIAKLVDYTIDSRARSVKRLENIGFSREDAIIMTSDVYGQLLSHMKSKK